MLLVARSRRATSGKVCDLCLSLYACARVLMHAHSWLACACSSTQVCTHRVCPSMFVHAECQGGPTCPDCCAPGYQGEYCSKCAYNYYRSQQSCLPCKEGETVLMYFFIASFVTIFNLCLFFLHFDIMNCLFDCISTLQMYAPARWSCFVRACMQGGHTPNRALAHWHDCTNMRLVPCAGALHA